MPFLVAKSVFRGAGYTYFQCSELIELENMPNNLKGISPKAKRNNWLSRKAVGQGRALEYHISSFHPEIQDQLIEKYITNESDKTAFREYIKNFKIDKPESNVSKVVPMTEFKEWSELPVFNVHAAAGAGSLISAEYAIEKLMIPTSLLAEFGLSAKTSAIIYVDGDSM